MQPEHLLAASQREIEMAKGACPEPENLNQIIGFLAAKIVRLRVHHAEVTAAIIEERNELRGELFKLASEYYARPECWPSTLTDLLAERCERVSETHPEGFGI